MDPTQTQYASDPTWLQSASVTNKSQNDCQICMEFSTFLMVLGGIALVGSAVATWQLYSHIGATSYACLSMAAGGIVLIIAGIWKKIKVEPQPLFPQSVPTIHTPQDTQSTATGQGGGNFPTDSGTHQNHFLFVQDNSPTNPVEVQSDLKQDNLNTSLSTLTSSISTMTKSINPTPSTTPILGAEGVIQQNMGHEEKNTNPTPTLGKIMKTRAVQLYGNIGTEDVQIDGYEGTEAIVLGKPGALVEQSPLSGSNPPVVFFIEDGIRRLMPKGRSFLNKITYLAGTLRFDYPGGFVVYKLKELSPEHGLNGQKFVQAEEVVDSDDS